MVMMMTASTNCWRGPTRPISTSWKQYHNPRYGRGPIGGNYYAGTSSISANVPFGAQTMATPDGRKAHTPLAEGASPASGYRSSGADGGYQFGGQAADRGDPRRRAA
ncbi:pyruvate formate-lyase [Klebsiella pneumoniae]|uniref:Pyruvate formate-lyase n=1 Tax=Klebsiella pneumoniae TaxID=573 RepID=A0A377UYG8_KLEPN|nr:pyruvate formate-lyase [Klebsiella pneumoniae]